MQQQAILWAKDGNMSLWLSIWPLARSQFDLSARNLVMVLLYVSHSFLYLLYVMVVEHYLVLSIAT